MNKINLLFAALFVLAIAVFFWWLGNGVTQGLPYQPNMATTAASVIGALLVVTLVIERAAAVVNQLIFGEEERQAEYERIQAAKTNTSSAAAEAKLTVVLSKKARVRLLFSFVTGLFVSAAGVRTLQGLLILPAAPNQPQALFYPVDIVLTAALIAGGSASLAFLAAVLKDLAAPPPTQPPAAGVNLTEAALIAPTAAPATVPAARPMSVGPRLV
jgi:hypothetical protein